MGSLEMLTDGDFANLSPNPIQNINSTVIVNAPSSVGSWSVDLGTITLSSPFIQPLAPYNGGLPSDSDAV